jgi:methylmalonyl-CoA/ethylmalonyl-CoA epimerase
MRSRDASAWRVVGPSYMGCASAKSKPRGQVARLPRSMTSTDNLKGLHHIGVAVNSIDEALPRWLGMGLVLASTDVVPTERVKVAVLMAGGTRVELLEPTSPESPIAKFLEKRGPGVHHLAFHVGDCQVQIDALALGGAALLDAAPRKGAHDCKVAFLHPKQLLGVLAELVEDPHAH